MQDNFDAQELKRLDALRRTNLLDTPAEEAFDCITRIAKTALNAPIALITFVDKDRQWFKSRQGITVSETARDISFCSHTIQGAQPLVIPNLRKDPAFKNNPLVSGFPFLRSYCGVPLRTKDGYNIGALCVIGYRPRRIKDSEMAVLLDLANLVIDQIELRQIVNVDYITGLAAHPLFLSKGGQFLERAQKYTQSLGVIAFEIDQFSELSLRYGTDASDRILQAVAERCKPLFSSKDVFARVGGGQFAALLPGAAHEAAKGIAQHIASEVGILSVPFNGTDIKVTVSAGATTHMPADKGFSFLFTRAEIELQKAKRLSQAAKVQATNERSEGATFSMGFSELRTGFGIRPNPVF